MPALVQTKYEDDAGRIHPFAMTADYFAATSSASAAAVTDELRPKISKTKREYGLKPRGVRLSRTVGVAPNTFKKYTFLAVIGAVAFASAEYSVGTEITINGVAWTVIAKVPEEYN